MKKVDDIPLTGQIYPELVLQDCGIDLFSVVDSFLITNERSKKGAVLVKDLHTGKEIATFGRYGRGPSEFVFPLPPFSYTDGSLLVADVMLSKVIEYNLKDAICKGELAEGTEYKFHYNGESAIPMRSYYKVDNNSLLLYNTGASLTVNERGLSETPDYLLFDLQSGNLSKKYDCFCRVPTKDHEKFELKSQTLLYSFDCIDSRLKKVCFAMANVPQINILDIDSGDIFGVKFRNMGRLNMRKVYSYFISAASYKDKIFALYSGERMNKRWSEEPNVRETVPSDFLYVFDWSGNACAKYSLGIKCSSSCCSKGVLYVTTIEDDNSTNLCSINLSEII